MKKIALIAALAFIGYSIFSIATIKNSDSFKAKLDSLTEVNDYLLIQNQIADSEIAAIQKQDSIYIHDLKNQKAKVIKIKEYVEVEVNRIDNLTEQEIVTHLNQRYPKDTVTNPLPVAQPVLVSASKDLAAYDGAKQEIVVKDSVITLQDKRLVLKDSTIGLYIGKESRYKSIIGNKDQAISEWNKQYDALNLNYKKLQIKSKFQRIATYVIIGGLTYTMLVK